MTDAPATFKVRLTKVIPAAPERVFEAWLREEALAVFIRPAPGVAIPKVELDPRVGGKFLIVMRVGASDIPHHGEYRIIDRYTCLAFTWHSAQTPIHSLVTLDFEALGPAKTRLTLLHEDFPDEKSQTNHEDGWGGILSALADSAASDRLA